MGNACCGSKDVVSKSQVKYEKEEDVNKKGAEAEEKIKPEDVKEKGAKAEEKVKPEDVKEKGAKAEEKIKSEDVKEKGAKAEEKVKPEDVKENGAKAEEKIKPEGAKPVSAAPAAAGSLGTNKAKAPEEKDDKNKEKNEPGSGNSAARGASDAGPPTIPTEPKPNIANNSKMSEGSPAASNPEKTIPKEDRKESVANPPSNASTAPKANPTQGQELVLNIPEPQVQIVIDSVSHIASDKAPSVVDPATPDGTVTEMSISPQSVQTHPKSEAEATPRASVKQDIEAVSDKPSSNSATVEYENILAWE